MKLPKYENWPLPIILIIGLVMVVLGFIAFIAVVGFLHTLVPVYGIFVPLGITAFVIIAYYAIKESNEDMKRWEKMPEEKKKNKGARCRSSL